MKVVLTQAILAMLLSTVCGKEKAEASEVIGTCGTRGEIKQLVIDTLCKEPKEARKVYTDKMWKCKSGALDKATLTRELLQMAAQDTDRASTCKPIAALGGGARPGGGGATGGGAGGGGGAGAGIMDADDVPCTRESIDRIFMQVLYTCITIRSCTRTCDCLSGALCALRIV